MIRVNNVNWGFNRSPVSSLKLTDSFLSGYFRSLAFFYSHFSTQSLFSPLFGKTSSTFEPSEKAIQNAAAQGQKSEVVITIEKLYDTIPEQLPCQSVRLVFDSKECKG